MIQREGWGTARNNHSKVWFSLTREAVAEVCHPTPASPRFHRLEWIIPDTERPMNPIQKVEPVEEHSLAFRQLLQDSHRRRLEQTVITDPLRQSLAIRVLYKGGTEGSSAGSLFLRMQCQNSRTWTGFVGGKPALFLQVAEGEIAVLASTAGLGEPESVTEAETRHQILSIPVDSGEEEGFTLVLSFGDTEEAAAKEAEGTLLCPWSELLESYNRDWQMYCGKLNSLEGWAPPLYYRSLMLFRALEDKKEPGSFTAGLPGEAREAFHSSIQELHPLLTAFWAAGELQTPKRALKHLYTRRQQVDGSFSLPSAAGNGSPSPAETACAILLAWQLEAVRLFDKGVRPAADFLVRCGATPSPEAGIAALVCAADLATSCGDEPSACRYRETADQWMESSVHQVPQSSRNVKELLGQVRWGLRPARDPLVHTALKTAPSFGQPGAGDGKRILSVGERAHYELLLDRDVAPYLSFMEAIAEKWGLLPETETGGMMPDLTAHAEYVRLLVSQSWGTPCDRAPAVAKRYADHSPAGS